MKITCKDYKRSIEIDQLYYWLGQITPICKNIECHLGRSVFLASFKLLASFKFLKHLIKGKG